MVCSVPFLLSPLFFFFFFLFPRLLAAGVTRALAVGLAGLHISGPVGHQDAVSVLCDAVQNLCCSLPAGRVVICSELEQALLHFASRLAAARSALTCLSLRGHRLSVPSVATLDRYDPEPRLALALHRQGLQVLCRHALRSALSASELAALPLPPSLADFVAFRREARAPADELILDIVLAKTPAGGFGFSITGGADDAAHAPDARVYIHAIAPGSPAALDGRLQAGDVLLAANGVEVAGMSHRDISRVINENPVEARLRVLRPH
jgi:hypothetical protein